MLQSFAAAQFVAKVIAEQWGRDKPGATGQIMVKRHVFVIPMALLAGLMLAACQPSGVTAPSQTALADELVRLKGDEPPPSPDGECWAKSTTPAIIETVTEQELVSEEVRDDTGAVIEPAAFRTRTHQRMVQDREEVWFQTPCPEEQTVQFVASVQRALKARGLYLLPVTGVMDADTAEAIRRFQADRGLDSPVLSLGAARALGISAFRLDDL